VTPGDGRDAASILDRPADVQALDPAGMRAQVATIPDQVRDGWARTRDLTVPAAYRAATSIAVLGMGGSAIGGDLVHDIFADRLTVPLEVVRGYDLPAWVGAKTLVVAVSYSGATEETISALEAALRRRCPVLVVTTGGPLREVARRAELPHLVFPGGGQPRAAVGHAVALLAGLLERTGHLTLAAAEVEAAATAATATLAAIEPGVGTEANLAKQLAWELLDRVPLVIGSGAMAAVARRWKTQFNENGKSDAIFDALPEASHNTIVGFDYPADMQDQLCVVFLTGSADHPRDRLRATLLGQHLDTLHVTHRAVACDAPGRLAAALQGIVFGDLVSVYLAVLYGVDPTPVEAISTLKAELARLP